MNIPLTPLRFLRYAAQQYPRRTAVVCNDDRFTYAQMAERVSRLAGALREAGMSALDFTDQSLKTKNFRPMKLRSMEAPKLVRISRLVGRSYFSTNQGPAT